ncbi:hypothetical protein DUI87_10396 [Hirundo rustica rustica]|uniref:Uncharacterized protein n=1 Tax=Hirundo rustica rustica TaxID=333673 RepID=A0A3M0KJQ5_HIRRU|nr:hypothetical protein DUI87_10396 [Hirundo rustica rustica]
MERGIGVTKGKKITVKLIQSDVLLHKADLDNEVILIPYGATPKVYIFQKKLLSVFSASLKEGEIFEDSETDEDLQLSANWCGFSAFT